MKYLGIDWGEKRIGLALADEETRLALPFKTVDSLWAVQKVISEEEVGVIVLGVPLKLSGQGKLNQFWQAFKDNLEKQSNLPLALVDERLSSKGADALFGSDKVKAGRDEIAAAVILQDFLDKND
ncbi:MAG: Holliday junction resolvase RuvX [Patescibacteria group bacterium]